MTFDDHMITNLAIRLGMLRSAVRDALQPAQDEPAYVTQSKRDTLAALLEHHDDAGTAVQRVVAAAIRLETAVRGPDGVWDAEQALWTAVRALPEPFWQAMQNTPQPAPVVIPEDATEPAPVGTYGFAVHPPEVHAALAEDANHHGMGGGVTVLWDGEQYRVMDGSLRVQAARLAGVSQVPAMALNPVGGDHRLVWLILDPHDPSRDRVELHKRDSQ